MQSTMSGVTVVDPAIGKNFLSPCKILYSKIMTYVNRYTAMKSERQGIAILHFRYNLGYIVVS